MQINFYKLKKKIRHILGHEKFFSFLIDRDNEKYISIKLAHNGKYFSHKVFYNNIQVVHDTGYIKHSCPMNDVLKITTPSSYVDLILQFNYVLKENSRYSIFIRVEEVRDSSRTQFCSLSIRACNPYDPAL